jgi:hypothetical protein
VVELKIEKDDESVEDHSSEEVDETENEESS